MGFSSFKVTNETSTANTLKINLKNGHLEGVLSGVSFIDADTKQFVSYIPALELSGYGETMEKAEEMIQFSMSELFQYFMGLSSKNFQIEMEQYGWKQGFFNKNFSKSYVDIHGELQNFNIEENSLNDFKLTAA